jgi:superfamily II RNA helicase
VEPPKTPRLYKSVQLDPFQEQAIDAIDKGHSVLICAPTGAGKTLVAEYAIEKCIRDGRRLVYTAPIKALNNQKFRDFSSAYPGKIGIKTGDVSLNTGAPILLMTTEIFRNMIFEDPELLAEVEFAVLDEIHYLDDIERGTVWEECIIFAPAHIRLVCLSATVPNFMRLADWIRRVRKGSRLEVIFETTRPVPLEHHLFVPGAGVKTLQELEQLEHKVPPPRKMRLEENWVEKLIGHMRDQSRLPCIFFCFNRRACEELAHQVAQPLLTPEQKELILGIYDKLSSQFQIEGRDRADEIRGLLAKGVCFHHAGLLPTVKEVIERIFSTGLLKILFATETFAVGINMPARSVVFSSVFKFDGRSVGLMKTREHHQMSGRAGRRGIDSVGYTYSVAEWPQVPAAHLRALLHGQIEPIRSQFNLSYSTVLTLWSHLRERIFHAVEQSLSNFLAEGRRRSEFGRKVGQVRSKLNVLRQLGYLHGDELTARGRAAMRIYGYELPITEIYASGLLDDISDEELAMVLCSICYESKKGYRYRTPEDGRFRWLRRTAYRLVERITRKEREVGLEGETRDLDFRLSGALLAWMRGSDFTRLERYTSADPGDVVRFFRMTIQILRNTLSLADDPALRRKIRRAIEKINRDEVDAERQLRLGGDVPEEVFAARDAPPEQAVS